MTSPLPRHRLRHPALNVGDALVAGDGRSLGRRQFLQRAGVMALGVTALPAALAACSGSGGSGGSDSLDITWAQASGPPDMNPLRRFDVEGAMVLALGLETLVKYDKNFQLIPSLASDFGPSSDLITWTFKLREGINFSDGSPLTIDDVLYSYQQHLSNPQSAFGFFYNIVGDISAKGNDLVVTLKSPNNLFGFTAAHTAGLIWQQSSAEQMGNKIGTPGNLPIGSGPFQFVEYVQDDHVTLKRNDAYQGTIPEIPTIDVRTIPDDSSRLLAMRSGQISGTFDVPPEQFDQWDALDNATVTKADGLGVVYLAFNVTMEPFDDIHARRAFSYALDREGLVKSAIQGAGEVATAFVPPRFWSSVGVSTTDVLSRYAQFPQYEFDLDKAEDELKQSKYASGGTTVKVTYPSSLQRLGKVLLTLKENLAPLGVILDVGQVTEDQWFANLYENRETEAMQVVLYRPDFPDPANYASFFATDQIDGGNNFGSYSNPQVDQLIREQSEAKRTQDRIEPLMKILEIVQIDAVIASAWWESSLLATSDEIVGYADPVWYLDPWALSLEKSS